VCFTLILTELCLILSSVSAKVQRLRGTAKPRGKSRYLSKQWRLNNESVCIVSYFPLCALKRFKSHDTHTNTLALLQHVVRSSYCSSSFHSILFSFLLLYLPSCPHPLIFVLRILFVFYLFPSLLAHFIFLLSFSLFSSSSSDFVVHLLHFPLFLLSILSYFSFCVPLLFVLILSVFLVHLPFISFLLVHLFRLLLLSASFSVFHVLAPTVVCSMLDESHFPVVAQNCAFNVVWITSPSNGPQWFVQCWTGHGPSSGPVGAPCCPYFVTLLHTECAIANWNYLHLEEIESCRTVVGSASLYYM
jgi:hypothetical protein